MHKLFYSCEEHIETVLDMYIDDHETPPEFRKIEHTHSLSTACELCAEHAIYIVGNE
ncbi:CxxH/CxxC protein [Bacillus sp. 179-C3.3 HS]|uniref:CxxH/CxxC protein n=1 Tax=Bacillus sp. 179-C3.3 HS TaxID=3232162 RepID=UPI0039A2EAF3